MRACVLLVALFVGCGHSKTIDCPLCDEQAELIRIRGGYPRYECDNGHETMLGNYGQVYSAD